MNIRDAQIRLRRVAHAIGTGKPLQATDRAFISEALDLIADGEDANAMLEVKGQRGKRKGVTARGKDFRKRLAMGWIAAAMEPEEEGEPRLTLEQAIGKIGEHGGHYFGLTEETLRTYWNKNPEFRQVEFVIPGEDREED